MANTAEVLRIMLHAAERLEREDPFDILPEHFGQYSDGVDRRQRATSMLAAKTYAAVVLRMVAAFMTEEPAPETAEGGG